jgi:hypothetical protein
MRVSSSGPAPTSGSEARDHRRWLIGVGISLVFGLFGMVMALLSYSGRGKPAAPSTVTSPSMRDTARDPAARPKLRGGRHPGTADH